MPFLRVRVSAVFVPSSVACGASWPIFIFIDKYRHTGGRAAVRCESFCCQSHLAQSML